MRHGYPLNLILEDRKCLVVGSGPEAAARVGHLLEAGAQVLLVGDEATAGLDLLTSSRLRVEQRAVTEQDLDDAWLVVQVSPDPALARQLCALCEARRIFFCAVDQPKNSSYSHLALARAPDHPCLRPASVSRPALGRRLREELSRVLSEANAAEEVERIARLREKTAPHERREVLAQAVEAVQLTGTLKFRRDEA